MAWSFGDGFDLYAVAANGADIVANYWDSGLTVSALSLQTGRFAGSQALRTSISATLVKSSGVNDAVHHLVLSFQQTTAISGSTLGMYFELFDGATGQCSIVFRSDGAILLTSGGPTGTVLATYTGAFPVVNTWYAFECEVVVNNTTGSFTVRKNGNTTADFTLGSLNTRTSANNYANKLQLGQQASVTQNLDDLFWRSDAASVAWMGDIRCYTRMPASDQSVQFSRAPASYVQTPFVGSSNQSTNTAWSFYTPFTATYDGTVSLASVSLNAGFTGNLKCSVFNDASGNPGTVRASATTLTNPTTGSNILTFPTPFSVVKGGVYWMAFAADGAYTNALTVTNITNGKVSVSGSYAAFPAASPTVVGNPAVICSWTIGTAINYQMVSEPQQDAATSYVYDSTPGHADLYGIASIASTPSTVIAVTTRGYMQKSDAGSRTAAVNLKSGSTTVASPTLTLTTSGWQWAWRTDTVDPATSAAWTAAAVNNAQIGPTVIA